jgi:hypothetical protein
MLFYWFQDGKGTFLRVDLSGSKKEEAVRPLADCSAAIFHIDLSVDRRLS